MEENEKFYLLEMTKVKTLAFVLIIGQKEEFLINKDLQCLAAGLY